MEYRVDARLEANALAQMRSGGAAAAAGVSGFTSHTDVLYASSGHIYTDINDWCRQRVCAESVVECLFVRSDL